ncbi:MAG TPA: hypothetical protein VFR34_03955 [Paracoccaceae bacterium]|nr:hypothetical protein [Paracoccaceae bacterium]
MAFRFPAQELGAGLLAAALALGGCSSGAFLTWEPDSDAEKAMRLKSERLQATVGEGALTGFAIGAALGGLLGGGEGAFRGAQIGRFLGAGAGSYVRQLQAQYAEQEAVLEQVAMDIGATNAELEATIADMRTVLEERRAALAAAEDRAAASRAEAITLERQRARSERALVEMNGAIEAANRREAFFGEARSLLEPGGGTEQLDPHLATLARSIQSMREIATLLSEEL